MFNLIVKIIFFSILITNIISIKKNGSLSNGEYNTYQISCGTNYYSGCRYSLRSISRDSDQTMDIFVLTVDNYQNFINSNGNIFKYYADISSFNTTNYQSEINIEENALILIIKCHTKGFCYYSSINILKCIYPSCQYHIEYDTKLITNTTLIIPTYNADSFDTYIVTNSVSHPYFINFSFFILIIIIFS